MITLAKPSIPEKAIKDVVAVLRSGNLVQGKFVEKFEDTLKDYLDVNHAILVSSGTAALHLALMVLGIKAGDEVIVPAFTFPATVNVVEAVGAKPVLVDINLDDFCLNAEKIEGLINEKTRAIIPVHEFGQAADITTITTLAEKYGVSVIEDAACALGTEYQGRKAGTFGRLGCFSFHPRKAITTGEGGAIVTNDDKLAKEIKALRNHGMSSIDGKIDFILAGLNYRITDFQAALGLAQLNQIGNIIENRISLAKLYDRELQSVEMITTPAMFNNRKMIYQTYHVLVHEAADRDLIINKLGAEGIQTNFGAQAIHCMKFYREKYSFLKHDYPNATYAYEHGLALPMGDHVKMEQITYITVKLMGLL